MSSVALSRTTTALLRALQEPRNDDAWRELCARCEPIMRATAARMGLADADVDDVVQSALVTFLDSYRRGQYDRERGRLSVFLVTILRSRVIDLRRKQAQRREVDGASQLGELPSQADAERIWSEERQRRILAAALEQLVTERVDPRAVQAFELYGVRGMKVDMVGMQLDMTRDEVYDAKYRIARRLQPIVARLDEAYEDV